MEKKKKIQFNPLNIFYMRTAISRREKNESQKHSENEINQLIMVERNTMKDKEGDGINKQTV